MICYFKQRLLLIHHVYFILKVIHIIVTARFTQNDQININFRDKNMFALHINIMNWVNY